MARDTCSNPVFGSTRNPWDPELCPGASSGGSGAALAAGLCALADGSDIGGSIRQPAGWCNVVRPPPDHLDDPGRFPTRGSGRTWETPRGPMARTVSDTALFLSVLAGPDLRCPVPITAPFPPGLPDLATDLSGLGVGWSTDHGSARRGPGRRPQLR